MVAIAQAVTPVSGVLAVLSIGGIVGGTLAYFRGSLAKTTIELYESNNAELRATVSGHVTKIEDLIKAQALCDGKVEALSSANDLLKDLIVKGPAANAEFLAHVSDLATGLAESNRIAVTEAVKIGFDAMREQMKANGV